jgi:hypothetical protein
MSDALLTSSAPCAEYDLGMTESGRIQMTTVRSANISATSAGAEGIDVLVADSGSARDLSIGSSSYLEGKDVTYGAVVVATAGWIFGTTELL